MLNENWLYELFPTANRIYSLNGIRERVCVRFDNLIYLIISDSNEYPESYEINLYMFGSKTPFKTDIVKYDRMKEYSKAIIHFNNHYDTKHLYS